MRNRLLVAIAVALSVSSAACSDVLGPGEEGLVRVGFRLAPAAAASASQDRLVIVGTNGTLRITDISFIVNEFKLESEDDACLTLGDVDCEEFEAPPRFVRLPLGNGTAMAVTQAVPAGTYSELEFEIEDLDLDEGDDDATAIAAVAGAVRAAFPNWPGKASMVMVGTFTPTGSTQARPFTVFFDAEIEVEIDLVPPLIVDQANTIVTVVLDPSPWFRRVDGTVMDMSAFDFVQTGIVLEFEAELENGFTKVEFGD